jgi:lipoprotein-anchoring transpeptidase ErfK/SrfK
MLMNPSRFAVPVVAALLVLIAATPVASAAVHARGAAHLEGVQSLLALDRAVTVRAAPAPQARVVGTVARLTPLTGVQTVLPVIGTAPGPAGVVWARVRLPSRPNGATGWVRETAGSLTETPWQIVIHRSARRATVLDDGRVRATFTVVVGKQSTPTPLGSFFVTEKLHLAPGVAEGPWALATSAYSEVLQQFGGGPGQVALHGIVGLSDPLGTFSSHGCVRFANSAITWIAAHVGAGTPVIVRR